MSASLPIQIFLLALALGCAGSNAPEPPDCVPLQPASAVEPAFQAEAAAALDAPEPASIEHQDRIAQRRAALEARRDRLERTRQLAERLRRPAASSPSVAPDPEALREAYARQLDATRELARAGLDAEPVRP